MVVRYGGNRKPACTDVLCEWNKADMKGVAPAPISEILFYDEKVKGKLIKSLPRRVDPQPLSNIEKEEFLQALEGSAKTSADLPIALSLFR